MRTVVEVVLILILVLSISLPSITGQIRFSVCDGEDGYGEHCVNLGTIAHCDTMTRRSASVQGMWVFTQYQVLNTDEIDGTAEFLYQDRIGVPYHTFSQAPLKNGGCWRRIGYVEDYKTDALSLFRVTGLLSDSTSITKQSVGNSTFCLEKMFGIIKSFAILGNSSWTLTTKSGDLFCVALRNPTSFIPGLVLDIKDIGIAHGDICTVMKGCDVGDEKVRMVTVDNTITHVIYKREGSSSETDTTELVHHSK